MAATDPEGVNLAYSLVGDSGSFEIDETSGELFYNGSGEDYESGTTQFTLTVRASGGSETADTTVTVNVTDVEETSAQTDTSTQTQTNTLTPTDADSVRTGATDLDDITELVEGTVDGQRHSRSSVSLRNLRFSRQSHLRPSNQRHRHRQPHGLFFASRK